MSRLSEWVEREEHLLRATVREVNDKIGKYQAEITALLSDDKEARDSLAKLLRAKEVIFRLEKEEDCNGQLKLEGME